MLKDSQSQSDILNNLDFRYRRVNTRVSYVHNHIFRENRKNKFSQDTLAYNKSMVIKSYNLLIK